MNTSLVMTIIGPDQTGLVEAISRVIASHRANWLESRMSHLAGHFAGILRVLVPTEASLDLIESLKKLEKQGLKITVVDSDEMNVVEPSTAVQLEFIGHDRPGIVREVSEVLAQRGVNVDELHTEVVSAAMSGDILFKAMARLRIPKGTSIDDLRGYLEEAASRLTLDLQLEELDA